MVIWRVSLVIRGAVAGIMCLIPIAAKYLKIGPVVAICSMALRTGLNTPDVVK